MIPLVAHGRVTFTVAPVTLFRAGSRQSARTSLPGQLRTSTTTLGLSHVDRWERGRKSSETLYRSDPEGDYRERTGRRLLDSRAMVRSMGEVLKKGNNVKTSSIVTPCRLLDRLGGIIPRRGSPIREIQRELSITRRADRAVLPPALNDATRTPRERPQTSHGKPAQNATGY